jgi:hypothetical protein
MVDRITSIFGSEASTRTETGHTLNLGSDAQNAWVAARQSKINHDIEELHKMAVEERAENGMPEEDEAAPNHEFASRQWVEPSDTDVADENTDEEPRLSGESERIGTQNFDEDTPFGDRTLIV